MRAGRLRDKVSVETLGTTEDSFGQPVDTWTESAVRRCSIEPLKSAREFFAAQGENTRAGVMVRFRYEKGLLSAKKRLADNRTSPQTIYDIESVIDADNNHKELICMCVVRG